MVSENPLQSSREQLPVYSKEEAAFRAKLSTLIDIPSGSYWAIDNVVKLNLGDVYVRNLRENISRSQVLRSVMSAEPQIFNKLFWEVGKTIFESAEDIEVLVHNVRVRQEEISRNEQERNDRVRINPLATDEEYRLGRWKELLESQVRSAVLQFERKGYQPYGSGFDDLTKGTESIWFNTESKINLANIEEVLYENLDKDIASKIFRPIVHDNGNEFQIEVIPRDRMLPLSDWKMIWDNIAAIAPELPSKSITKEIFNGTQGDDFRNAQNKIKEGKSTWLEYGMAYVGGKVIEMPHNEYVKSGIEDLEHELGGLEHEIRFKKGQDISLIQIEIDKIKKELDQKTKHYIEGAEQSKKLQ